MLIINYDLSELGGLQYSHICAYDLALTFQKLYKGVLYMVNLIFIENIQYLVKQSTINLVID